MLTGSNTSKKQDFSTITFNIICCTGASITLKASTEAPYRGKTYMISAFLDKTEQSVRPGVCYSRSQCSSFIK